MCHGKAEAGRAETRKAAWELPMEVLVCQVEEFGFPPADNWEPRDVFQQANPTCSYSVGAERGTHWTRETLVAGN